MANDLVPRSFWTFPSLRFPSIWDDDEDFLNFPSVPSGLSVSEDANKVYVEAELPGLNASEVEVTFDKGILWIKGEANEEDKSKKYYKRSQRSFSYRVAVPGDIDLEKEPEAEFKNGVMTVSFFKSPKSQPKKIQIKSEE